MIYHNSPSRSVLTLGWVVCLAFPLLAAVTGAPALSRAEKRFGPPVDARQHLYLVNPRYVLAVVLDVNGDLAELRVEPRGFYFESHPEWGDDWELPHLSRKEFRDLVDQLERIQPKGKRRSPPPPSQEAKNRPEYLGETYDLARLRWVQILSPSDDSGKPEIQVGWIKVVFNPRGAAPAACPGACRPVAADKLSSGANLFELLDQSHPCRRVYGKVFYGNGETAIRYNRYREFFF